MKYSADKDVDLLVRALIKEGWIFRRGKKHGRLASPSGGYGITVSGTPSDHRTLLNMRRDVRKAMQTGRSQDSLSSRQLLQRAAKPGAVGASV